MARLLLMAAAALLLGALLGCIVWASMADDVVAGFRYLMADRWGIATLLDVYAGAFVVAAWMWATRRSVAGWGVWVVALALLGHVVSLVYLLLQLARSPRIELAFTAPDRRS